MNDRYFFLHIPKTAGTTLNTVLDENFGTDTIFDVYTDEQRLRLRDTTYEELIRYRLVRGHVFITNFADILDGPIPFKVFTFLRDPVERVVSEYHFLKNWPKSHLYRYLNENDISLSLYVTSNAPELRMRGRNCMVNSLSGVGLASIDEGLDMAWHHLKDRFAFYGLLERFDESLLMLAKHLDLRRCLYERHNVRGSTVRYPVSPEEAVLIREHNQADIALYDLACTEYERRVLIMGDFFQKELTLFKTINGKFQRVSRLIMERDGIHDIDFINGK